jgi:hypothetical protein
MIGRTLSDFSGGIGTTRAAEIPQPLQPVGSSAGGDVISIDAGSHPASRAIFWNSGIWAMKSPRAIGIQPSP